VRVGWQCGWCGGVDGGVVMHKEVVARGCGFDGRWFMSSGKMVAINSALVSEEVAKRGPVRPRDLTLASQPSRTPSKSVVLGGSCFVASPAAWYSISDITCGQ
jgi:hypothetical protein